LRTRWHSALKVEEPASEIWEFTTEVEELSAEVEEQGANSFGRR
jgi:hypothetical protein